MAAVAAATVGLEPARAGDREPFEQTKRTFQGVPLWTRGYIDSHCILVPLPCLQLTNPDKERSEATAQAHAIRELVGRRREPLVPSQFPGAAQLNQVQWEVTPSSIKGPAGSYPSGAVTGWRIDIVVDDPRLGDPGMIEVKRWAGTYPATQAEVDPQLNRYITDVQTIPPLRFARSGELNRPSLTAAYPWVKAYMYDGVGWCVWGDPTDPVTRSHDGNVYFAPIPVLPPDIKAICLDEDEQRQRQAAEEDRVAAVAAAAFARAQAVGVPAIDPPAQATNADGDANWTVTVPGPRYDPQTLQFCYGNGSCAPNTTVPAGSDAWTSNFSYTFSGTGTYVQSATLAETAASSPPSTTVVRVRSGARAVPYPLECPVGWMGLSGVGGSRVSGCKGGVYNEEWTDWSQPEVEPAALPISGVDAPAQPSPIGNVNCGDTILSGTVVLTGNVTQPDGTPCYENGVVIAGDGVTLDLNGHQIIGATIAAGADEAGIVLNGATGAKVTDSTARFVGGRWVSTNAVTGFDAGVAIINGATSNTVEKLNIVANVGVDADYGEGVHVRSSGANTIKRNIVAGNGPHSGISLIDNSDANVVSENEVTANHTPKRRGEETDATGIRLEVTRLVNPGCPDNNTIVNNAVSANALDGISILNGKTCDSQTNEIVGNEITGNGRDGIRLNGRFFGDLNDCRGSHATVVHDNVVTDNGGGGIKVTSCVDNSVVRDNTVILNNPNVTPAVYNGGPGPHGDLHDNNVNCRNSWSNNLHVTEYAAPGSTWTTFPTDFTCLN